MSSIGTGYDLSASQFSPDGRVFQVEYAQKAVENCGTAIALKGKDGIVFAVEKLGISKLYTSDTNNRIYTVDEHVGMAVCGLIPDSRQIVETAKSESRHYRTQYGGPIPLKYLNERVSMYMHAYTLYSAIRPFGSSVIIGAVENGEPSLYMIETSGVSYGYYGCATGKAKQVAKTEIEKVKNLAEMNCLQLVKEAARIIYLVHDELKDKRFDLELSWIGPQTSYSHCRVPANVKENCEKSAKETLDDESDSDHEI